MIHLKQYKQKAILIAPQIQPPKTIKPPESEKLTDISIAPRKYKKSKSTQTEKSELIDNEHQSTQNFDDILEKLKITSDNSKSARFQINLQKQKHMKSNENNQNEESISFVSFIEFDMHGGDYHISDPFDWIYVIKEIIKDASDHNVDMIKFIPGQGKHTHLSLNKKTKDPILRALTLITTKMLNYNSYIDKNNKGIVICPLLTSNTDSSVETERRELIFNVFLGTSSFDLSKNDVDINDEKYEEKINIIQTFDEVKKAFPQLLDCCTEIVSIWKKETKEAIDFLQKFFKYFNESDTITKGRKQLKRAKMKDEKKKENEMFNIVKLVNKFQQKYGFDRNIIKRIVEEHKTEEKCEKVLDKIYHDMLLPYIFFKKNFSNFVLENETIPISSLLDTFKECEFEQSLIQRKMSSQSYKDIGNALRIMKVKTNIDSKRSFNEFFNNNQQIGLPKFVPTIEINLENAGIKKALSSIGRVMDGLSIGDFCEMILIFSNEKKINICTIENVRPFIEQKAEIDGYQIFEKENKNKFEYHFYIINKKTVKEEEEVE